MVSVQVLVLGGGGFLGYHVADQALRVGHDVTVFSRSDHAPLPGVEVVTGDRRDRLDGLRGRQWDAVVDTFTDNRPGAPAVRRTAQLLTGAVGAYCYVSGMSVYAPSGPPVPDETAPVRVRGTLDNDPLQARSEAKLDGETAVLEVFRGHVLIPRVGIMVGPRDPSHRFTWWPMRFWRALAGRAPAVVTGPGQPARFVQYSDARDIARWLVEASLTGLDGILNAVGPLRDDPLGDVLDACRRAAREARGDERPDKITVQWQPDEALLRDRLHDVEDEQRPLWYPENQIPQRAVDSSAAFAAGLRFRPAFDTALDTLRWALDHDRRPLEHFREPV